GVVMSTYTCTGPPGAWNVDRQPRSSSDPGGGTRTTCATGATYSAPGRDMCVPPGTPSQSPCSSEPSSTASYSQCGRPPHLVITTRTVSPGTGGAGSLTRTVYQQRSPQDGGARQTTLTFGGPTLLLAEATMS